MTYWLATSGRWAVFFIRRVRRDKVQKVIAALHFVVATELGRHFFFRWPREATLGEQSGLLAGNLIPR